MNTQTVRGTVRIKQVARGSKAEQSTAVLITPERSWLLRRSDGPSFGVDPELAALDGHEVTATGYAGTGVFLLSEPVTDVT
ncbi:MAG: hypothetical protein QOF87_366 [Pseudonocardiales bacterium]|jgi:hypothetical protein|nr:hypothetical protein [Pseudonocardiales bacterium]MDT4956718.1 hypothetical protein [Pseudonocardiales bacterium]MDT4960719.1 hypothetical protein [Pseudonocardiales bacterium]MDT4972924.1 hypothetical protein [Pseudonocardiales bacterium]MDT4977863.1 hypothetical protein [Pseudonocardiales bacterium]